MGRKKRGFKQEPSGKDRPWWKRAWGRTEFGKQTGWDWRQLRRLLLVVALALVVIGSVFSTRHDPRQQAIEDQRDQRAQQIEGQRAQSERQPKEQRPQYAVLLQSYLDQMSYLMYEKDLRASDEGSEVRTLARARTLKVLVKLDPSHKTMVVLFLAEANLVRRVGRRRPVLSLSGAKLGDTDLSDTDLSHADLSGANLGNATLSNADLSGADLSGADLTYADLEGATLSDADLSGATLLGTGLSAAELADADLSGAILEDANLGDANLRNTDLNGVILYDADLSGADFSGALGLSKWSLAEAAALAGVTMPDGTKHSLTPTVRSHPPLGRTSQKAD